eukprot:152947-Amorphochlora_amoeboformis.AAC.1
MSGRVLSAFQKTALRAGRPRKRVVPIRDWKYFKGDTVKVMTGKARGEVGVIMALNKQKNTVAIEDVNMARKIRNGKFVKAERAVHYSNVLLLDPESGKPTRVRWEWTEEGEKVFVSPTLTLTSFSTSLLYSIQLSIPRRGMNCCGCGWMVTGENSDEIARHDTDTRPE